MEYLVVDVRSMFVDRIEVPARQMSDNPTIRGLVHSGSVLVAEDICARILGFGAPNRPVLSVLSLASVRVIGS
jgi:hypothetical protein